MDRNLERDGEMHHGLHLILNQRECPLKFLLRDLKDQFIVDLHDHLGGETQFFDPVLDPNHRHLDDICCCSLKGRIDRHPLGGLPNRRIGRVDVRQIAAPMEKGGHITFLSGLLQTLFDIGLNPRISS